MQEGWFTAKEKHKLDYDNVQSINSLNILHKDSCSQYYFHAFNKMNDKNSYLIFYNVAQRLLAFLVLAYTRNYSN